MTVVVSSIDSTEENSESEESSDSSDSDSGESYGTDDKMRKMEPTQILL